MYCNNTQRVLSQYPLEGVGRICVDSVEEKTFAFVVLDSLEHFLCFRATVKGTSLTHNVRGHWLLCDRYDSRYCIYVYSTYRNTGLEVYWLSSRALYLQIL